MTDAKILIVDDDQYIVRLLFAYMKEAGFTNVSSITDSRKAVDAYLSIEPDLLILDLFMPFLDGFSVMERIKTLSPEPPNILILTFLDEPSTRTRALDAGAVDVLGKPFGRTDAITKIKAALAAGEKKKQP
ncbi:MAG: response regulator [Thermodesulfobacteriota bacterium]